MRESGRRASSSSVPASAASLWPHCSARPDSPTSWFWRRPIGSAVYGGTTPIRAVPATFRRRSTRTRSRRTRTGHVASRHGRRSLPTWNAASRTSVSPTGSGSASTVTDARWTGSQWEITCADGAALAADILIPAMGQLSRPAVPDLPGADTFAGPRLHTARWDPDARRRGTPCRRHRHRSERDPARTRDCRHCRARDGLPTHAAVAPTQARPPLRPDPAGAFPPCAGGRASAARRHLGD